jgi:hypothetical protein
MDDRQKKLLNEAGFKVMKAYCKAASDIPDARDRAVLLLQPLHYISRELVHGVLRMPGLTDLQKRRAQIAYEHINKALRALNRLFEDYEEHIDD